MGTVCINRNFRQLPAPLEHEITDVGNTSRDMDLIHSRTPCKSAILQCSNSFRECNTSKVITILEYVHANSGNGQHLMHCGDDQISIGARSNARDNVGLSVLG